HPRADLYRSDVGRRALRRWCRLHQPGAGERPPGRQHQPDCGPANPRCSGPRCAGRRPLGAVQARGMTMAWVIRLLALLAAVASPATAQGIDPRSEAAALYNAQQAAVAGLPTATPTAQLIPGYGGDAQGLQGYATN